MMKEEKSWRYIDTAISGRKSNEAGHTTIRRPLDNSLKMKNNKEGKVMKWKTQQHFDLQSPHRAANLVLRGNIKRKRKNAYRILENLAVFSPAA
ncbi:hypothetical protein E2C01_073234 [Portunus trituberculatus]|uniref:Uncharacterized protein n=1 Tax=Portunus trituberculatus TaxID=210409 RepID=A0A5B7IB53_PORTR|nr:hypothetical protein [Portunus trituberculatus]